MYCYQSIIVCFVLAVIYICSLYLPKPTAERNHPTIIKRRIVNVLLLSIFAPVYLKYSLNLVSNETLWSTMGFKTCGFGSAIFYPLFLTMILFLGPLTAYDYVSMKYILINRGQYIKEMYLIWLRNYLVAPISEELIFRSCMLPILLKDFSPKLSITIASIYFGLAHSHHVFERTKSGMDWSVAIQLSIFQVMFTTIFGAYSTFLFYRTGHFVGIVLVHIFCNLIGFPDLGTIFSKKGLVKYLLIFSHVFGLILWALLLMPLTNPQYFCNNI